MNRYETSTPRAAFALAAVALTAMTLGLSVIIPAGMEIMDKAVTEAVEPYVHAGYPLDAEAILIVESDGTDEEVEEEIEKISGLLERAGASHLRVSSSEQERYKFWSGRKSAWPSARKSGASDAWGVRSWISSTGRNATCG